MAKSGSASWTAIGWGLTTGLTGVVLVRMLRPERTTIDIAITAAVPWALAPSWPLLAGALVTRRRCLAAVASALAAYHATCLHSAAQPSGLAPQETEGPKLRVAFANVWRRNANVEGILDELAGGDNDIVALAEVADCHVDAIDAVLPKATYPWRWSAPDGSSGSKGLAVVSRVPLAQVDKWSSRGHPQVDMVALVAGALPCRLLVVHTWAPVRPPSIKRWRAQLVDIADRAQVGPGRSTEGSAPTGMDKDAPAGTLPTVIMGDFNATHQHRSFERLVRGGWTDAASLRFGGWRATWPANRRWRPPIIGIDHILVGPGVSVEFGRAGRARGSDHRPVSAVLVLPPASAAGG
jgi:endonuclease/exonuclease/phosphatase (EEP) superfamily protein YafD